jgi:acyl dehydratase
MAYGARRFRNLAEVSAAVGQRLGESGWHQVTQRQVDRFAEVTGDDQWIHVDPARAATGPFGGPVAHGYLVVSLIPVLLREAFQVDDLGLMVNTGVEALRFRRPVAVGTRLRLLADLLSVADRARGAVEVVIDVRIDLADDAGPACQGRVGLILRPARPRRAAVVDRAATTR